MQKRKLVRRCQTDHAWDKYFLSIPPPGRGPYSARPGPASKPDGRQSDGHDELLNSNALFLPRFRLFFNSALRLHDSQFLCRTLRTKRSRLRHVPTLR